MQSTLERNLQRRINWIRAGLLPGVHAVMVTDGTITYMGSGGPIAGAKATLHDERRGETYITVIGGEAASAYGFTMKVRHGASTRNLAHHWVTGFNALSGRLAARV